jgi:hypothetical protein
LIVINVYSFLTLPLVTAAGDGIAAHANQSLCALAKFAVVDFGAKWRSLM